MRHDYLDKAIIAAQTFIQAANEAKRSDAEARRYCLESRTYKPYGFSETFDGPSKDVAAVKRRSLDLTRALAELRKRDNQ
jgi:hypothetical protein